MIINFIIPKQRLITIAPEKVLCSDVLVWELDFFFRKRTMDCVIVMFRVQLVGVQQRDCNSRNGNTIR